MWPRLDASRAAAAAALALLCSSQPAAARAAPFQDALDAEAIGRAAGTEATTTDDGVVRIGWARDDVRVTVGGMPLEPFAGLGSWAAFHAGPRGAMVMGDTVVFQDEVSPAMDAAFEHDLEVTALHNHFFHDEPKVYFMHVGGSGDAKELAAGVRAVWDAIRRVREESSRPARRFPGEAPRPGGPPNAERIEEILGHEGDVKGGVVKVTIGRAAEMHGVRMGGSMGITTWAAFSGDDERAAVGGDFAMTAAEVQPVLRALRAHDIHVVALHNHMIGEEPALYFTHYWGVGPVEELASGIAAALEAQRRAGGPRGEEDGR